ncbi:MAG: RHS repeat domain-containing protein, partial [Thermoanaerobaculia bacterium]
CNMTFNSAVGAYSYGRLPHAVTAAGAHTLRYDAAGNLASRDAATYSFDEENRLSRVDRGGGNISEFGYDAFGRRVRSRQVFINGTTIGGSDTVYLGDELACQGDRCTTYVIAAGRRIAARTADGELFFFHDDLGASSVLVTDAAGNVARESRYGPFGEPAQQGRGAFRDDRKRFAGYEYDDASGLYFMATRFYDPVLGAFISPDSTVPSILDPQSLNRFAYSRQNPYSFVDRDGEGIWFAVIAGAIIGALAAGHSSDWDGQTMFWGALAGAAAGAASFYVAPAVAGAAELGGAGGATAGILGSAAGGAAGGLASAGVYRMGGYDVDPLQSTMVGGIAGGFGGAAKAIAGGSPPVGAAVESGVKAELYQENPWQAALQGWAGSVAGTIGQSVFAQEEPFSKYSFESAEGTAEVIALRPAAGDWKNALWAYGVGDGYSHVLLAVGNGEFYETTPDNGAGRVSSAGVARYSSRQYIKAHVDLNVNAVRAADRAITQRAYLHPYVCSSYVNAISGGMTWGLIPGHVVRAQQGW